MATKKTEKKLKYTKTWEKDFGKRYNKVMKELKSLEDEFKKMKDSNPDRYISKYSIDTEESIFEFTNDDTGHVYHQKKNDETEEYVEISFGSGLSSFAGKFFDLKELIQFRNDLTEAIDKFEMDDVG